MIKIDLEADFCANNLDGDKYGDNGGCMIRADCVIEWIRAKEKELQARIEREYMPKPDYEKAIDSVKRILAENCRNPAKYALGLLGRKILKSVGIVRKKW